MLKVSPARKYLGVFLLLISQLPEPMVEMQEQTSLA
jgi:hypothetical protein